MNERKVEYYEQTRLHSFYLPISSAYAVDANEEGNILPEEVLHRDKYSDNFNCRSVPTDDKTCKKMIEITREKDLHRLISEG